nr:MAG TPA: hypothetical protein [Caudoviricetes sp.]
MRIVSQLIEGMKFVILLKDYDDGADNPAPSSSHLAG